MMARSGHPLITPVVTLCCREPPADSPSTVTKVTRPLNVQPRPALQPHFLPVPSAHSRPRDKEQLIVFFFFFFFLTYHTITHRCLGYFLPRNPILLFSTWLTVLHPSSSCSVLALLRCLPPFFFFLLHGHTHGICKFPGQGLNP